MSVESEKMPDDPTSTDAEWKKIQQNTFTRWCNEHLKNANQYIHSLETDLCDGLKLIALLQVLSHKRIAKYNKKPSFKPQKVENISIALAFVESEKIKLVNIDASDIFKGNLKLILGLIWTLILKYQISIPMMDDDSGKDVSPKQALMGWVRSKLPPENVYLLALVVPSSSREALLKIFGQMCEVYFVVESSVLNIALIFDVKMNNFSSDWNNGIALASLVDACAPGLMPEWEDLNPSDKLDNCREAMKRADDWLGVPQVLTPEEIANPNVDELSVMTYVSYFPEAKLKPGAPLKNKLSDAGSCSAYGPGLEPEGVTCNVPADFTVVTTGSSRGKLNISVLGPGKQIVDCLMQDNHNNTFSCQYVPPKAGTYDVHVRIGSHHIPKSPFRVKVSSDLDVKKVYARGPGIEPSGVVVGKATHFEVVATGAGSGEPHIDVIDPKGNKKTEVKCVDKGDGVFEYQYLPLLTGKYVICVKFGGEELAKSPFRVQVDHPATKVKIYGPGLEPGLKVGKLATFTVDCADAGDGNLDISVEGPGKANIPVDVKDNGDGTFTCSYKPTKAGTYIVTVFLDRQQVPKSPVKVNVAAGIDLSKIRAWGPGLEKGAAGSPAEFYVEAKGTSINALSFAIEGPGEAKFDVTDNGQQKCTVKYYPTEPGVYTVHIMAEELDIPHSPYKVDIRPRGNASKVYAEGPGLKPGCTTGKPATFTIYTQKAGGAGDVEVTCTDESGNPVEVKVKDNKDETYSVSYMPIKPGTYTIIIKFAGDNIDKSPFKVLITPFCDPSKVKAEGPGLRGGKTGKPCEFKIDASKAGEGGIGLTIEGPTESQIDCDDHGDGTCSVKYFPKDDGDYVINILFADTHIPGSPFKAVVSSDFDASKVKAYGPGLEPGCKAGRPCEITIDAKRAGRAKLNVEVSDEVGNPVKVDVQETEPGLFNAAYHPEKPGKYTVLISFGGKAIPKSPFKVTVEPSSDASKVKVSGPGIEPSGVKSNEPTYFEIDASQAGDGDVDVSIEPEGRNMPKVTDISVEDGKKPNTYKVKYVAPKEGPYRIIVKFGGKEVPKSPFKVGVKPGVGGIKCYGPGLQEPLVGEEVPFTVDCGPGAGDKPVVEIINPEGKKSKPTIKEKEKGVYEVTWTPKQPGKHKVVVLYAGEEVPDSPFNVTAVVKGDASKVKASGPGLDHAFINKPNTFDIDTRAAGPGNLGLAIEGPAESKITCEENNDGTHTVSYTPVELGDYDINIRFGDEHIPGSPFKVPAQKPVDASKVKCSGPGLDKVPASLPTHFTVDAKQADKAPLDVEIIGPDRKKKKPKITNNGDNTYDVEYTPDKEGKYTISVKYGGNTVPQSPFRVTAVPTGDASKCKVSGPGVERAPVGLPAKFKVDAAKAGPGKVTAEAKNPKGEELPVTVKDMGDGVFACDFVPEEVGEHELDVLFGGVPVKGSPFHPQAVEPVPADKVKTPGLEELLYDSPAVETPVEGMVDTTDAGKGKLDATLQTPTGKKVKVGVSDNKDGTYTMNFTPKEVGHYVLTILFEGSNVPGSPFEFEVVEGGPRKVKVYGPGIRKGFTGRPNCFTVDTKNAGPGGLSLAVEGPSQADINCIDNGDGTCLVTYTPDQPGDYDIIVKFADEDVPDSPFKVKVVEDEPIYEVGRPCDVEMAPNNVSMPEDQPVISGVLATPSGKEKPIGVKKGPKDGPDNAVIASFTPEEAGKHDVGLKKRGNDVDGSPQPVYVRDKPIIGKPCEVPMECADVARPDDIPYMKATLTRPNDKEEPLDLKVYPDGTLSVKFIPKEPGRHLINVKKHGKHVDDSPYVIMVEEPRENVPVVGRPVDVNMEVPNLKLPDELDDLESTLKRPNGKEEPVSVKLGPDDTVAVSFTPKEPGEHILSVKKKGKHIPDSPFSIMVAGKAPKGPTVGSPCDVNIDSPDIRMPRDLKDLEATVRAPNGKKTPAKCKEGPEGTLAVEFTPKEPGKHLIDVLKRGKPVEGSPFPVMVQPLEEGPVVPLVDEPCECNLDIPDVSMPKDLKNLEAFVTPPNGKKAPADVKEGPGGTVCVDFTPKEPGKHKIDVLKNGKPVKGSPFEVAVESKEEPITAPTVGHPCDVNLDIPGIKLPEDLKSLQATVERPNGQKEPVEVTEGPENTLAISFTPKEPGKHLIEILKNKRPVKGSPFEIMVEEAKPSGKGPTVGNPCDVNLDIDDVKIPDDLKDISAVLARPNGQESPVDVKEGPGKTLSVEFVPEEPGKHLLHVKKRRRPVNGSPFTVMVEEAQPGDKRRKRRPKRKTKAVKVPDVDIPDDLKHITAYVVTPSGKEKPVEVGEGPGLTLEFSFEPDEPGKHLVHVKKRRRPIKDSPFTVMVEMDDLKEPEDDDEATRRRRKRKRKAVKAPDVDIPGDLKDMTAYVETPSGKEKPAEVGEGPDKTLEFSFEPEEPGKHLVHVKKRRRPIKDSPFTVDIVADDLAEPEDDETRRRRRRKRKGVKAPDVDIPDDLKDMTAYVETPSGKEKPAEVGEGPNKTLEFSFEPDEPGKHLVHVKKRRRPIKDSPFTVDVVEDDLAEPEDDETRRRRRRKRKGVKAPDVDIPDDLKDMTAYVETPSGKEKPAEVGEGPDKTLEFSFEPDEPGKHLVHVKKRRRPIKDSPFTVDVVEGDLAEPEDDETRRRRRRKRKGVKAPDVDIPDDLKDMTAYVETPSGKEKPAEVGEGPNKTLEFSFEPDEPGKHLVHVKKRGRPIKDSPFTVDIVEGDLTEPEDDETRRRRRRKRKGVKAPDVDIPDDLKDMTAYVETPSGKEKPAEVGEGPNKTLEFSFEPDEPGKHLVHVKKRRRPIKDSPFTVDIVEGDLTEPGDSPDGDSPDGRNRRRKKRKGVKAPDVDIPDDLKDLTAVVETPSGKEKPADVCEGPNKTLEFAFEPDEPGNHLIHVKKKRRPIKDSPFNVLVEKSDLEGPEKPGDSDAPSRGRRRPRRKRKGMKLPDVKIPDDLKDLKAVVEAPSGKRKPGDVGEGPDGTFDVYFEPEEPGKHLIHVTKKGKPVKDSPISVMVDKDDLTQPKDDAPHVGEPYTECLRPTDAKIPDDLPDLKAYVETPSGKEEPATVGEGPDHSLAVSFEPKELGKHLVHVKKRRRPLKDSPFEVIVVPKESDDKAPRKGQPNTQCLHPEGVVMPDDLPDLKAYVEAPSGKELPAEVAEGPDHSLAITFKPEEVGKHLLHVKKRRRPIKESPFEVMVLPEEPEKAPTVGSACQMAVPAGDITPQDMPDVKAYIERPSGKEEPVDVKLGPNNALEVTFVPQETGKHLLHIKKRRRPINGSPFTLIVEAAGPEKGPTVGNPCDVNLEIQGLRLPDDLPVIKAVLSRPNGAKEDLPCAEGPNHSLAINFTPKEPGEHLIDVTKRGKPLPESPFRIVVEEAIPSEKEPTVGTECDINLDIPNLNLPDDLKQITGTLKRPSSDKEEPLDVHANPDNTLGVSFTPKETGPHEIGILNRGRHVNSSPFIIHVKPAKPAGEARPTVGSPCDVSIEIPGIRIPQDLKHLNSTLTRPNGKEEPLDLKSGPDQTLLVSFVPKEPGKHLINIKRSGQHVPCSPVVVMVDKAKPKKPGQQCDVGLEIPGIKLPEDLKYLTGTVETPSGNKEPVELQPGPNNKTILVSFLPKEVGKHKLHIKRNGTPVGGSPFEIEVKPEDVVSTEPDASKVKIYGKGLNGGPTNKRCEFVVDTRDAGYGGLGLSIEGPSKVEINCVDNEDGTCTVDFTPTEEGVYTINVTYAEEHVPGSPVKIRISDKKRRPVDEDIMATNIGDVESTPDVYSDILAFPRAKPQQDFVIKFAGSKDLSASVTRPSGKEDDAEVVETGKDTYTVRFVPKETGEHLVHVKHRNRDIPGSPFKVSVETPAGGAAACRAFGPGLEKGVANQPCKFTVVTRDAGPGGLAVAVEGPAKAEIQCHDNGDGSCDITWYPVEAGEYTIHIRFADEPIPGSAFTVDVVPEDENSAMSMQQFKDQVLRMGQQASFAVQMKGKRGKITASVVAPSRAEIECSVVELDAGNYAVRFVPRELGDHLVSVFLDGQHIPGSPFTVRVGGIEGDPSKVRAYGPGLRGGVVGRPAEFVVNALEAGSGALALSIDGPAKVKMNCVEQEDGTYQVSYTPTVPGSYEISIRFAGQHITGSAYRVIITSTGDSIDGSGTSDASKCTSRGPGLQRATVGEAATFTVNASDAGRGMIMVGVEGPVIPAKEILVRHTGNNVYSVNYILEEPGVYILQVLWGDAHIPGSPFHVTV